MSARRRRDAAPGQGPRKRLYAVVAIATLAFAAALAAKDTVSVWWSTTAAAGLSLTLAATVHGRALRRSLRWRRRDVAFGVGGGILMAGATHLLYPLGKATAPGLAPDVAALYGELRAPPGVLAALPLLVLVVAAEEVIWRGLLIDALSLRRRLPAAVLASSLFYTLPQVGSGSAVLFGLAIVCGALWGAERVWTRSLLAPTLTHLVWNLLVFVAFPLE